MTLNRAVTFTWCSSPLEQFEVYRIPVFFNNVALFAALALVVTALIFLSSSVYGHFLPRNPWSSLTAIFQQQLMVLVARNIGAAGQVYFPFLFTLFIFLLMSNLLGMVPYTFTTTSHIVVTLFLSFTFFIGTNLAGVLRLKLHYFGLFLPSNSPVLISPFLLLVELISYFARVASLAIRLFANMMAGHSLLKILIGFVYAIFLSDVVGLIWGWLPFLLVFLITFLEVGVAFVQAYVFTTLLCIYIRDLYHAH